MPKQYPVGALIPGVLYRVVSPPTMKDKLVVCAERKGGHKYVVFLGTPSEGVRMHALVEERNVVGSVHYHTAPYMQDVRAKQLSTWLFELVEGEKDEVK